MKVWEVRREKRSGRWKEINRADMKAGRRLRGRPTQILVRPRKPQEKMKKRNCETVWRKG